MKALTQQEVLLWCQHESITVSNDGHLYFPEERRCIAVELPEKPYQLVALANALLPYTDVAPFKGAVVWFKQWGVWSELVERVGLRVMELMRQVHHVSASLDQTAPACLFNEGELIDLQVSLVQPLLVGWDAFLIPRSAEYIVATSHDETTHVISRTAEIHRRLLAELQRWNPRDASDSYFRHLQIPFGPA